MNNHHVYRAGSRFLPTDVGLVRIHLKNMVVNNKSGFITTLDVYKTDPWLLDHVNNDLFKRDEWYYFVPRTKRGGKTPKRTIPGAGTWKSTSKKEPIENRFKVVEGYKQNLSYYKSVKGKVECTGWVMTEFCLHKDVHEDLVLCHIRGNIEKSLVLVEEVPRIQEEEDEGGFEAYANEVETMMLEGGHEDAEVYHQPASNEKDIMMWPNQVEEQLQLEDYGFDGAGDVMFDVDELLNMQVDDTQQQGFFMIDELLNVEGDVTQRHVQQPQDVGRFTTD